MMRCDSRWWLLIWVTALGTGVAFGPPPASAQQETSGAEPNQPSDSQASEDDAEPPSDTDETASESDDDTSEADQATEQGGKTDGEGDDTEEVAGTRYELETVVQRARTNSDLLAEFEAKRNEAEWKAYRAKWAPAPKIESMTTLAPVPAEADPDQLQENFDEIANLNIGPFVSHRLDLIVPVYTFGRISKFRELADVGIDVTELKRREAQLNAVFQAKRAYYSLRLAQTFEPLLEEGDTRIEKKLDDMEEARAFGEADFSTKDFRKLEIFATEVDSRMVDNDKLAELARYGLQYLAELEAERIVVPPFEQKNTPPELATYRDYLQAAREHRPDLQQLDKALKARKLQVGLEKSKIYPEVFFSTGLRLGWSTESTAKQPVCERRTEDGPCLRDTDRAGDLFAEPDVDPLDRFSIRIGLGMRWNVDILGRHGQIQEKQAQLNALQAQHERAEGAVALEIRKKFRDAADQLEKIRIYDRRLKAARRWRDQLGLSIQTAGVESDDAIEPLKAFYQAKAKYLQARYQYLVARAALAQSIGVLWLDDVDSAGETVGSPAAATPSSDGPDASD